MSESSTESVSCTPRLVCRRCGAIDTPRLAPGSGPHAVRANCANCGRFLQWVSRHTPEARAVRRHASRLVAMAQRPPSELQCAYLQALGDNGPPPVTMA